MHEFSYSSDIEEYYMVHLEGFTVSHVVTRDHIRTTEVKPQINFLKSKILNEQKYYFQKFIKHKDILK